MTNKQSAMIRELQRRGVDTSEPIPDKEWDAARISPGVRTKYEVMVDGVRQTKARAERFMGVRQVPNDILLDNIAKCRLNDCGSYDKTESGEEICWRCNCKGKKELWAKASNVNEKCPHEQPRWDNTKLTIGETDA